MRTDWDSVVTTIALLIIIVLTAGQPDLLDAIIQYVMNCGGAK